MMGCGIHLYVERRENNQWLSCDSWKQEIDEDWCDVPYGEHFYNGRNYGLFAILANVRNGYGFAGCDLGDGYKPIAMPRGLPDDVSAQVKAVSDQWNGDGHSHSWLTVREIMAYDWTQITVCRGVVSALEYWQWTNGGAQKRGEGPDSFCGAIAGRDIEQVKESELKARIAKVLDDPDGLDWHARRNRIKQSLPNVYAQVSWEEPYWKAGQNFLGQTLPRLWALGAPDDIRIVFFFDN